MKWKAVICFILLFLVLFALYFFLKPDPTAQQQLQKLSDTIENKQIMRLEIYYLSWSADIQPPMSPQDLKKAYQYKITNRMFTERSRKVVVALAELDLTGVEHVVLDDYRLGCIIYSGREKIFEIYLLNQNLIARTGTTTYGVSANVLETLIPFLPDDEQVYLKDYLKKVTDKSAGAD